MKDTINHILQQELSFHFTHSSGHGGQNINKRKTKAELYFNIDQSHYLSDIQKQHLKQIAANKIHHNSSILILTNQEHRSQHANKQELIKHFTDILHML
jgi:protein subunit release factor B